MSGQNPFLERCPSKASLSVAGKAIPDKSRRPRTLLHPLSSSLVGCGLGASLQTVTKALAALTPGAVIMVGIALVVNETKRALGGEMEGAGLYVACHSEFELRHSEFVARVRCPGGQRCPHGTPAPARAAGSLWLRRFALPETHGPAMILRDVPERSADEVRPHRSRARSSWLASFRHPHRRDGRARGHRLRQGSAPREGPYGLRFAPSAGAGHRAYPARHHRGETRGPAAGARVAAGQGLPRGQTPQRFLRLFFQRPSVRRIPRRDGRDLRAAANLRVPCARRTR